MQTFVQLDAEGFPQSFYRTDIWAAEDIPPAAFEISEEQWGELLVNNGLRQYVNGTWTEFTPPPLPPQIPQVVTPRQARLALAQAGLLSQVNAMIRAADEATQITWDYATEIRRTDPLILALGAALGLSDEAIDNLFILAVTL